MNTILRDPEPHRQTPGQRPKGYIGLKRLAVALALSTALATTLATVPAIQKIGTR